MKNNLIIIFYIIIFDIFIIKIIVIEKKSVLIL